MPVSIDGLRDFDRRMFFLISFDNFSAVQMGFSVATLLFPDVFVFCASKIARDNVV